jgi:16S rRNA (adenine1518-N6/adenine1519-N6)-dimethyltransferase
MRFKDSRSGVGGSGGARSRQISGHRVTPRKSLGQNFLQDEDLARWIVDQVDPDDADLVIEAGPGLRALTRHLEGRPKHLLLVEKDREIAAQLRAHYEGVEGVELLEADATTFDLRPWFKFGQVRFVGNLPYSVGSEILRHLLTPPTPVARAVIMLQKEVCERLAAKPGSEGCSALSALVQRDWDVEWLRTVGPEVFVPKPKVDSAVVRMTPRDPASLPICERRGFERVVKMGFSQRRKQLKNLLPPGPESWGALAEKLGLPETMRAQELTLEQWVMVTRWYEGRTAVDAGQKASEVFDVVDENDEVIEQRTRGDVHRLGLRHRAVHVLMFNRHGDLFLQQRSHLKDVSPMAWDSSAAGHLDSGESYAEAAVREIREELGVVTAASERVLKIPAGPETDHEFVELHAIRHDGAVRWPPEEVRTGQWFAPALVSDWIAARPQDFARGFRTCWQLWTEKERSERVETKN